MGKEFLFKVEKTPGKASRYDHSFKVKKICADGAVIVAFKEQEEIHTPTKVCSLFLCSGSEK